MQKLVIKKNKIKGCNIREYFPFVGVYLNRLFWLDRRIVDTRACYRCTVSFYVENKTRQNKTHQKETKNMIPKKWSILSKSPVLKYFRARCNAQAILIILLYSTAKRLPNYLFFFWILHLCFAVLCFILFLRTFYFLFLFLRLFLVCHSVSFVHWVDIISACLCFSVLLPSLLGICFSCAYSAALF